jgi:hypothetical protein
MLTMIASFLSETRFKSKLAAIDANSGLLWGSIQSLLMFAWQNYGVLESGLTEL